MKKIYVCAAVAAAAAAGAFSQVFAAADCSLIAETEAKSITLKYQSGSYKEFTESADGLFKDLSKASDDEYTEEALTLTSSSKNGVCVDVSLRLKLEDAPGAEVSPLDYYTFIISDAKGNVIYNSEDAEASEPSATEKDMPIARLNEHFTSEVKHCSVKYKISGVGKDMDKSAVDGLTLELAAQPVKAAVESVIEIGITEDEAAAAAAAAEAAREPDPTEAAEPENASEQPEPAAETAASEAPAEKLSKTIVVGKDKDKDGNAIAPDRYVMKGNAVVSVKDKDGKLKTEETVTDGSIDGVDGVKQLIITLEDGDIITITPIEGQTKAPISLEQTNVNTATKAASDSNTGRNGAQPAASSATSAAVGTAAAKSSPKTGDGGMASGLLGCVMAAAAVGFGSLGYIKKKKSK